MHLRAVASSVVLALLTACTAKEGNSMSESTDKKLVGLDDDALHASATINDEGLLSVQLLNTTKDPIQYSLQIGAQYAAVEIAANSVQTVRVQLVD
jgi:glucosylceramidase